MTIKHETALQTIIKITPLIITVGSVVIAIVNAIIFIQSDTLRQQIGKVESQHTVMAQEIEDHEENQNKYEERITKDLSEIKQDIKTLLQRR